MGDAGEHVRARGGAEAGARSPSDRAVWLLVAVVTACGVAVAGAWQAWTVMTRRHATVQREFTHRMTELVIDAGDADVRVAPGAAGQVSLTEAEGWSWRRPQVATHWTGSTLHVGVVCPRLWGMPAPGGLGCDVRLDLVVPRGAAVTASTGSGTMAIRGVTGPVRATAGSGSLTLDELSGPLQARVGSGSVLAAQLASPDVTASADSGSVELGFRAAPHRITVRVDSGSATVRLPRGTRYAVRSGSGSGSGTAHVDPALVSATSPDSITATADSGSVELGYAR